MFKRVSAKMIRKAPAFPVRITNEAEASAAKCRSANEQNEHGVIAVVVALVAIVLLLFVGLALDTSLARDRGSSIQLAADAAALAAASALPDVALAQQRAAEAVARNTAGVTATVSPVAGKPGRISVKLAGKSQSTFSRIIGMNDYSISRTAYAEQSVGIAMGSPYNAIGTGDLPGMVPGSTALQGYFLAVNGPCTAKEDGDRFSALYEGTRGSKAGTAAQNADAYHCADDPVLPDGSPRPGGLWTTCSWSQCTGTQKSQWKKNSENRPGGYSYLVTIPCDKPSCGTLTDPVFVDAWDPWFQPWIGDPTVTTTNGGVGCPAADLTTGTLPSCVVDKVPIANHDANFAKYDQAIVSAHTKFAIFKQNTDGSYPATALSVEDFGSVPNYWKNGEGWNTAPGSWNGWYCNQGDAGRAEWVTLRRGGKASAPYCKDWFSVSHDPITEPGKYRVQVVADKQIVPPKTNTNADGSTFQYDGGRSFSINTFALRTRRKSQNAALKTTANTAGWEPCSTETAPTTCVPITGEGALSVYVKTPGASDLFLSKMSPAQDYRGRTIQVQLWDPGEGATAIKILQPVQKDATNPTGWKSIPFRWSTADPGLADFTTGVVVQDRSTASGWTSAGVRTGAAATAANGIDVSGTYAANTPPWPTDQRYGQGRFNGRLLLIDIAVPSDYGKNSAGADLLPSAYQGGWWKIRYETPAGVAVEDRTTWAVVSGGGPVHLVRE
jgi:Tfp pilus assembly protein PilX